jgi:hypothetical protein
MKKLTILYLGNFNPFAYSTEKLIKKAFEELGHQVITFDERSVNAPTILRTAKETNADLFLFHKGNRWGFGLDQLIELLFRLTCKKAFWYFDPINNIPEREMWMQNVIPFVDKGFLTNGTWIKQHTYDNLVWLLQGCEKEPLGKKRKEYECDIAFTGSVYGGREIFINALKKKYGDKFKVFSDVFGDDFRDLCASAKIMISPKFPSNNWFWSNRIYKTIGAGGFMLHPYCEGLKDHFIAGKEYEDWRDEDELFMKIDYYLSHEKERKAIQKAGYERAIKDHTYIERIKQLIKELCL